MNAIRILLAYREPSLGGLARTVLRRAGHEVIASAADRAVDVVLTDDPGLAAAHPLARVVLLLEPRTSATLDIVPDAVVHVPFTPKSLLAAVSRAMG